MLSDYYHTTIKPPYAPQVLMGNWYHERFQPSGRAVERGIEKDGFRVYSLKGVSRESGDGMADGRATGVEKSAETVRSAGKKEHGTIGNDMKDYKKDSENTTSNYGTESAQGRFKTGDNVISMSKDASDDNGYKEGRCEGESELFANFLYGRGRAQTTYSRDFRALPMPLWMYQGSLLEKKLKFKS